MLCKFFGVTLAILVACLVLSDRALAQSESSQRDATRPVGSTTVKKISATGSADGGAETSPEQKLAFLTLEASEGASRGFAAPMCSYGLLQIGSTLAAFDADKARSLLRDAFTSTMELRDDDDNKRRLQSEIMRTLVSLFQSDAEQLLPQAVSGIRSGPIVTMMLGSYAKRKQWDKGLELLQQIASVDEFPYGGASVLMDAMPADMAAEKQTLFTQALASYKSHEHPDTLIGNSTFTGMISRFGLTMPPKLALAAIDEVLSQAKAKAEKAQANEEIRLRGTGGSSQFTNDYQYQLFALLPTLRKLDEGRAKQFLDDNQDLQAKMLQFPDGMNSLMPPRPPGAADGTAAKAGNTSARPVVSLQDYLRLDTQGKIDAIVQEAESDPVQAIAHSMTLPLQLDKNSFPRARALENIARSNVKKHPGSSDAALAQLIKVVADLPLSSETEYLTSAADLYLQMDDKDKAGKAVTEGFKVAEKLLAQDTNPDSPNKGLKAWWPSTDAYRRFLELETKISDRGALTMLKEIKDPEIQMLGSVMVARALLGLPAMR